MSMQNSLEVRAPFLDHLLVELVNRAAARWKLRRGISKYVLKRILRPLVPLQLILLVARWASAAPSNTGSAGAWIPSRVTCCLARTHATPLWLQPAAVGRVLSETTSGANGISASASGAC